MMSPNPPKLGQATHPQTTANRFSFRNSSTGNAVETEVRAVYRNFTVQTRQTDGNTIRKA